MGNFATKLLQVVFQQSEFVGVTVQGQETRVVRPSESKCGIKKICIQVVSVRANTVRYAMGQLTNFCEGKKRLDAGKRLIILNVFK